MGPHGCIHAIENAGILHDDFAADCFLCWRTEDCDSRRSRSNEPGFGANPGGQRA
jgi:hypothetical protein